MGTPLDPSLFLCLRCESILQLGYNCTIRIESYHAKVRRHQKILNNPTQNSVVYTCHFCSQQNLKKGTLKGHMIEICVSRPRQTSELKPVISTLQEAHLVTSGQVPQEDIPLRPLAKASLALLKGKGKKREKGGSGCNQPGRIEHNSETADSEGAASTSSKRRRKSWTTLKDIVENSER